MPGLRGFSLTLLLALAGTSSCTAQTVAPLPVHVGGRIIPNSDGSMTFGWPAVYFESRFHGTAVTIGAETADDRLRVLVDGAEKALLIQPGSTRLTITGLTPGDHVVRLEKVTESQTGGSRFIGFYPEEGSTPLPPQPRARQIEFIGDSLTVGYGNTSPSRTCTNQEIHDTTDSQQSYAPTLARAVGADYRVNAYSGFGVIRNYDGSSRGQSMLLLYPRLKPDDPAHLDADSGAWRPQVIVINLGTNDFSTALRADEPWARTGAYVVNRCGWLRRSVRAVWVTSSFA